jgi:hypothetical protein
MASNSDVVELRSLAEDKDQFGTSRLQDALFGKHFKWHAGTDLHRSLTIYRDHTAVGV